MNAVHPTKRLPVPVPALHRELQRFARQVQWGFSLTLALSLVMLVVNS
jgi:hypothetical protein